MIRNYRKDNPSTSLFTRDGQITNFPWKQAEHEKLFN